MNTPLLIPASFRLDELIRSANDTINEAVEKYHIDSLWALFSGGHDSLTVTHVVSQHPLFKGVLHIDTGTGLKETRQYVEDTCKRFGWPLIVRKPATTYEMLIVRYGFPGPASHEHMYKYLKERPLRECRKAARKGIAPKPNLAMVGGMRVEESSRRARNTERYNKDKEGVWISAIYNWTGVDCNQYIKAFGLPRSIVKDTLHMSGDCFCGSYTKPGELQEIDTWFPYQAERIQNWQKLVTLVRQLGLGNFPEKFCTWGHSSGETVETRANMPMCHACQLTEHIR